MNNPDGWSLSMIEEAKDMGYSVFALHQLQPTPRQWNLARLRDILDSQAVNILDPYLAGLVVAFINGQIDKITGFNITDSMRSSRHAKQGQKGFGPVPQEKPSATSTAPPRVNTSPPQAPLQQLIH